MKELNALLAKWEKELTRLQQYAEDPPRLGGAEESSSTYEYAAGDLIYRIDAVRRAMAEDEKEHLRVRDERNQMAQLAILNNRKRNDD